MPLRILIADCYRRLLLILGLKGLQAKELTLGSNRFFVSVILIGSGFALALFFLRKPPAEVEAPVDIEQAQVLNPNRAETSGKKTNEVTLPSVTVDVTKADAEEAQSQPFPQAKGEAPKKISLKEFKAKITTALNTLPKEEPKVGLTEEQAHHMTPEDLKEFQPLIDIVQAVEDNPDLKKPAFKLFYSKCASDDSRNLAWTVRSRCLSKMRELAPELGSEEQRTVEHTITTLTRSSPSIVDYSNFIPN